MPVQLALQEFRHSAYSKHEPSDTTSPGRGDKLNDTDCDFHDSLERGQQSAVFS